MKDMVDDSTPLLSVQPPLSFEKSHCLLTFLKNAFWYFYSDYLFFMLILTFYYVIKLIILDSLNVQKFISIRLHLTCRLRCQRHRERLKDDPEMLEQYKQKERIRLTVFKESDLLR